MAEKKASIYDIVSAIAQAADVYDGKLDADGEPIKIGLRREEEVSIYDRRVVDGFKVRISGNILILTYMCETRLSDVYSKKFENDVVGTMEDVVRFLKSEFKSLTNGKTLVLKAIDEPKIIVQSASRVRRWLEAIQHFEVGNLSELKVEEDESERVSKKIKSFMGSGRESAKKPQNLTRKED